MNAPIVERAEPEFDMAAWISGALLLSITRQEAAHKIAGGLGRLVEVDGVEYYVPAAGDRMRVV